MTWSRLVFLGGANPKSESAISPPKKRFTTETESSQFWVAKGGLLDVNGSFPSDNEVISNLSQWDCSPDPNQSSKRILFRSLWHNYFQHIAAKSQGVITASIAPRILYLKWKRSYENPRIRESFNQIQPVYDGSFSTLQWKSLHPLVLLRVQPGNFPPCAPCRHLPRTSETCFSAKIHYKSYPHKCNANIWDSTYITTKQKTLVWSVNFMTSCIPFDTSETYITSCVWCLHRSETTTLRSMLEQSMRCSTSLSSPKKRRQIEQIELGQDQRWNISKFQVWIQHASPGNHFVW